MWHIITCEYPPQIGGVSDYTHLLARELHRAGDVVHIWAPSLVTEQVLVEPGIVVHRTMGDFSRNNFTETEKAMAEGESSPRNVLVQWVPHGYGHRSMNLAFCRWLEKLSCAGDRVSLMVHEPFLESGQGSWKQRIVAQVHRRMIRILLRFASRVFISIPAWERYLSPYAPQGQSFEWLPIPATIPVLEDAHSTAAIRNRIGNTKLIIGHLGTYSGEVASLLTPALTETLKHVADCDALLMGNGSEGFARSLAERHPELQDRVHATGLLSDSALSHHLSACDLMLQPYPDGLSSRRTSLMNVLAHGVAVVSNIGHLTEDFWSVSRIAAVASPGELAALCIRLLNDRNARSQAAQGGLALYRLRFDWNNIIRTLRSSPEALAAHTK